MLGSKSMASVVAVYEAAREAIPRAREDGGPTLIECQPSFVGHHEATRVPTIGPGKKFSNGNRGIL